VSGTVTVRKDDLGILVAACTSYFPPAVSPEVDAAFARLLDAWEQAPAARAELDALREQLSGLVVRLESSAEDSAPSRKSEIERHWAKAIRELLPPAIVAAGTEHIAAQLVNSVQERHPGEETGLISDEPQFTFAPVPADCEGGC
jgi:hypothetical protein